MADLTINTSSPAYKTLQTNLANIKTALKPYLELFIRLPADKQIEWIKKDKILLDLLKYSKYLDSVFAQLSEEDA